MPGLNSVINAALTRLSDGFELAAGITRRKMKVTGADVTITGSGSNIHTFPSAADTLVGRASSDTLLNKLLGRFAGDEVTPAALSADQNDYALTANKVVFRLSASGAARNITGFSGGVTGRFVLLINVGASNNVTVSNDSSSSTASNRVLTKDGSTLTLAPKASAWLWYDATDQRWRVI